MSGFECKKQEACTFSGDHHTDSVTIVCIKEDLFFIKDINVKWVIDRYVLINS